MQTLDPGAASWIHRPDRTHIASGELRLTTQPGTDLWQRTYYGFQNDNAPILCWESDEPLFSFSVRCSFPGSHHRFDQCGVIVYQDSDHWLKASSEYEDEHIQRLGSVATNRGYSDWATTDIPATVRQMHYRLSRRGEDFLVECSEDGEHFRQMRICHLWGAQARIRFGVYACSPGQSSFEAVFTDFRLGECLWQPHSAD